MSNVVMVWGKKNKGFLVLHTDSSCSDSSFKYLLWGGKGVLGLRIVLGFAFSDCCGS